MKKIRNCWTFYISSLKSDPILEGVDFCCVPFHPLPKGVFPVILLLPLTSIHYFSYLCSNKIGCGRPALDAGKKRIILIKE